MKTITIKRDNADLAPVKKGESYKVKESVLVDFIRWYVIIIPNEGEFAIHRSNVDFDKSS